MYVTAAVDCHLKIMLHLDLEMEVPHHEGGHARVGRDCDAVWNVIAAIKTSPFATNANLINISTGQEADCLVQQQLLQVNQIGVDALFKTDHRKEN